MGELSLAFEVLTATSTASDVTVPDRTTGQLYMTALVVILGVTLLAIAYRRNVFSGLSGRQRKQKSALVGSIRNQTPETVRIPNGADPEAYRDRLLAAFERVFARARGQDSQHDPDRVTVREAAGSVGDTLRVAVAKHRLHRFVPDRLTFVLLMLAGSIAVLAPPAMSTDRVVAFLESGSGDGLSSIGSATVSVADTLGWTLIDVLGAFPHTDTLFALALTVVLVGGEWLFTNWPVALVLALTGWGLLFVTGREANLERVAFYTRRDWVWGAAVTLGSIWWVGTFFAAIGMIAGHPEAGAAIGLFIATLLAVAWVGAFTLDFLDRLAAYTGLSNPWKASDDSEGTTFEYTPRDDTGARRVRDQLADRLGGLDHDPLEAADRLEREIVAASHQVESVPDTPDPDYRLAAYLLFRRVFATLTVLLLPLPMVYAAVGVSSGAYGRVISALFSGQPVAAFVLFLAFLAVVGLAYAARDAHEDVRDAIVETLARQQLRIVIFQRGLTVFALLVSYVVLWAFTQSYVLAPIGSLVIALAVYAAYEGIDRAAYRLEWFGREETQTSVLIQAYAAEDVDGNLEPVAKVGRKYTTSLESIEATVDDALTIASGVGSTRRSVPKTAGQQRAEDLLELGMVPEDIETELYTQMRQILVYELIVRGDGSASMDDLEKAFEDLPEDVWQPELERLVGWGILSRYNGTVRLERDCWFVEQYNQPNRTVGVA